MVFLCRLSCPTIRLGFGDNSLHINAIRSSFRSGINGTRKRNSIYAVSKSHSKRPTGQKARPKIKEERKWEESFACIESLCCYLFFVPKTKENPKEVHEKEQRSKRKHSFKVFRLSFARSCKCTLVSHLCQSTFPFLGSVNGSLSENTIFMSYLCDFCTTNGNGRRNLARFSVFHSLFFIEFQPKKKNDIRIWFVLTQQCHGENLFHFVPLSRATSTNKGMTLIKIHKSKREKNDSKFNVSGCAKESNEDRAWTKFKTTKNKVQFIANDGTKDAIRWTS